MQGIHSNWCILKSSSLGSLHYLCSNLFWLILISHVHYFNVFIFNFFKLLFIHFNSNLCIIFIRVIIICFWILNYKIVKSLMLLYQPINIIIKSFILFLSSLVVNKSHIFYFYSISIGIWWRNIITPSFINIRILLSLLIQSIIKWTSSKFCSANSYSTSIWFEHVCII